MAECSRGVFVVGGDACKTLQNPAKRGNAGRETPITPSRPKIARSVVGQSVAGHLLLMARGPCSQIGGELVPRWQNTCFEIGTAPASRTRICYILVTQRQFAESLLWHNIDGRKNTGVYR